MALHLLQFACTEQPHLPQKIMQWLTMQENRVEVFLNKWFHKQRAAERMPSYTHTPVRTEQKQLRSVRVQLLGECRQNKLDFCSSIASKSFCMGVLPETHRMLSLMAHLDLHGDTDAKSPVKNALYAKSNNPEHTIVLQALLDILQGGETPTPPTHSASLRAFFEQQERSYVKQEVDAINNSDQIENTDAWHFVRRNECVTPKASGFWVLWSPGSIWNRCQRMDPLMIQVVEAMLAKLASATASHTSNKLMMNPSSWLETNIIQPIMSHLATIAHDGAQTEMDQSLKVIKMAQTLEIQT